MRCFLLSALDSKSVPASLEYRSHNSIERDIADLQAGPETLTTVSGSHACWSAGPPSVELKIIQQQVGHSYASTTALYTSVSSDFRTRTLRKVLDGTISRAIGAATGEGLG